MRYFIFPLMIALVLGACNNSTTEEAYPEDLAGKKALLKSTKNDIKALNKLMAKLEGEINTIEPPKEKPRRLVTTQTIEKKDFKRYIDIQASVQSDDVVMASSETGGRIVSMNTKEGQYVKKGALIAKIDMESVDKQIAELDKSLELAVDVYNRQKRLWDQNIGSEMQYLQAKNSKERLEKSLEAVRFQLTKANVYAPISGVVDMVFSKAGEMTGPGAPIVQIMNTAKVKVVADVPERYLGDVSKGELVTVKFPALEEERQAKVSMLGRTINPGNRTFTVEVVLNNRDRKLKPNLLATMLINDFNKKDAIVVPLELVQQDVSGKSFLNVVTQGKDGACVKKTFVTTGESYLNNIVITEGLKGNEEIIMDGARGLAEGELLKVNKPVAEK